jgi:hypothetical protein
MMMMMMMMMNLILILSLVLSVQALKPEISSTTPIPTI